MNQGSNNDGCLPDTELTKGDTPELPAPLQLQYNPVRKRGIWHFLKNRWLHIILVTLIMSFVLSILFWFSEPHFALRVTAVSIGSGLILWLLLWLVRRFFWWLHIRRYRQDYTYIRSGMDGVARKRAVGGAEKPELSFLTLFVFISIAFVLFTGYEFYSMVNERVNDPRHIIAFHAKFLVKATLVGMTALLVAYMAIRILQITRIIPYWKDDRYG